MEYFWCALFVFAPLISVVAIWVACRIRRGKICRSTANLFRSALRDERGQDLAEYALMAGFVAVASSAVIPEVADAISSAVTKIGAGALTPPVVRVLCGVLAVGFILFIILRRRNMSD